MTLAVHKEGGKFSILDTKNELRYFNTLLLCSKFQDKNIVAMQKLHYGKQGFPTKSIYLINLSIGAIVVKKVLILSILNLRKKMVLAKVQAL